MAIRYKVTEKGLPGKADGPKKFYANSVATGKVSIKVLATELAEKNDLRYSESAKIIDSLIESVIMHLSNGESVKLGDFGTFSVSVKSEGKDSANEVNDSAIINKKITYRPGVKTRNMLDAVTFEKE